MPYGTGPLRTVAGRTAAVFRPTREPKRLLVLPGGHVDTYVGEAFGRSSEVQRDRFVEHLQP